MVILQTKLPLFYGIPFFRPVYVKVGRESQHVKAGEAHLLQRLVRRTDVWAFLHRAAAAIDDHLGVLR